MAKLFIAQEMHKSEDQVKFFYELVGRLNKLVQGFQVFCLFLFCFVSENGFMLILGEYLDMINAQLQFHAHQ